MQRTMTMETASAPERRTRWSASLALSALVALGCSAPSGNGEDGAQAAAPRTGGSEGSASGPSRAAAEVWTTWRGPDRNGTSRETGLVDELTLEGASHRWTAPFSGRGTPVVSGDRVYALAYQGGGGDLRERLICLDLDSGELIWERVWSDFLSDIVYDRYAIGSPTVDPETGHVYALSTPGVLMAVDRDGELLWKHSMMTEYGRLTFPNGRTGSPLLDGERLIVRCITSGWGPQAPAGDRLFAFDKATGENLWVCLPGRIPKDNSFGLPLLCEDAGRRMLVVGTGCGHVAAVDPRSGEALWRYPVSIGGLNSSVVEYDGGVIAIHGRENLDSSIIGRMVSLKFPSLPDGPLAAPLELESDVERWRNDLGAFSSSPVLVGNRLYQTVATGDLACVDADSGEVLWREKLGPDQIHASPTAADGKLYVPMTNGMLWVVRPTDEGPEVLSKVQLDGNCLGAPAIARGRILVSTTKNLYCFGEPGPVPPIRPPLAEAEPVPAATLQLVPADFVVRPGEEVALSVRGIGPNGEPGVLPPGEVEWSAPGAAGRTFERDADGGCRLVVAEDAAPGVLTVQASLGELRGTARVRTVPNLPYEQDFEGFELGPNPEGEAAVDPSAYWLGGKRKWDIRELDGSQVLAKALEVPLFQRTLTFFGHPEQSNYTMSADIRTDGNRRTLSTAGVIHQRYQIILKGNYRELEISSNVERIKESTPFPMKAGVWYRLVTRVDVAPDGSGVVRAKAWPRDEPEPDEWTLEVEHATAHTHGAPGLFGFAPQSRFRVYVDNLSVTPND